MPMRSHVVPVDDAWAEAAEGWDDNPAVHLYAQEANRSLRAALDREGIEPATCDVLDFGCGTGLLTALLAPDVRSVTGHDVSAAMMQRYRAKRDAAGWAHVHAEDVLPQARRFDLIVASSVLAFVPDLDATLQTLASMLRPGGLLVQWDWEAKDGRGLTLEAITGAYVAAGLQQCSLGVGFEAPFEDEVMAPLMGVARSVSGSP